MDDATRHLAQSDLYKENVLQGGHTAVWGSFYCKTGNGWGYACCRSTRRNARCPLRRYDSTTDVDTMSEVESKVVHRGNKAGEEASTCRETVDELALVAGEIQTVAELVHRYVQVCRRDWQKSKSEGKTHANDEPPTCNAMRGLLEVVDAKALDKEQEEKIKQTCLLSLAGDHLQALDKEQEEKIKQTCLLSLAGDHLQAQQAYLGVVIGSAKWVTGGITYISSDAPKGNERCWAQKNRTIDKTPSLLDNDAVRGSLQQFKRLLSFMEARAK